MQSSKIVGWINHALGEMFAYLSVRLATFSRAVTAAASGLQERSNTTAGAAPRVSRARRGRVLQQ
jgi:hypothetical protein